MDLDQLFAILATKPSVEEGTLALPEPPLPAHRRSEPPAEAAGGAVHNGERAESSLHATTSSSSSSRSGGGQASEAGLWVRLDDVHFSYGGDREVLKGVSIEALPGQSIAVVGPSGSGKSTVLKVLLRTYDVTSGRVMLDGVDVRDLTNDSLRAGVAVVG